MIVFGNVLIAHLFYDILVFRFLLSFFDGKYISRTKEVVSFITFLEHLELC